jgi:hypothetical protein
MLEQLEESRNKVEVAWLEIVRQGRRVGVFLLALL